MRRLRIIIRIPGIRRRFIFFFFFFFLFISAVDCDLSNRSRADLARISRTSFLSLSLSLSLSILKVDKTRSKHARIFIAMDEWKKSRKIACTSFVFVLLVGQIVVLIVANQRYAFDNDESSESFFFTYVGGCESEWKVEALLDENFRSILNIPAILLLIRNEFIDIRFLKFLTNVFRLLNVTQGVPKITPY